MPRPFPHERTHMDGGLIPECQLQGERRLRDIGEYERGSENAPITTLETMATALSVPVADLLTAPDPGAERPMPLPSGRRRKAESAR